MAAGNLSRQILEQMLLVLCFFSGMPRARYLRPDRSLHVASRLLKELDSLFPGTRRTYWQEARRRGPRIRKFCRNPRTLRKWQRVLNEPSHYKTTFRSVDSTAIRQFVTFSRALLDHKDKFLLVGALNELLSKGRVLATLLPDAENTPGIAQRVIVTANNLHLSPEGALSLLGPEQRFHVLADDQIPRGPWPRFPVVVQHSVGISMGVQFVTRRGAPVNIRTMETVLQSLATTRGERAYLAARLRRLGLQVEFGS